MTDVITPDAATDLEHIPPVKRGSVVNYAVPILHRAQRPWQYQPWAKFEAVPGMESRRVELNLGEGFEGLEHEVILQFLTKTGASEYLYKYVWRG